MPDEEEYDEHETDEYAYASCGAQEFDLRLVKLYNWLIEEWDDWTHAEIISILSSFIIDITDEVRLADEQEDDDDKGYG